MEFQSKSWTLCTQGFANPRWNWARKTHHHAQTTCEKWWNFLSPLHIKLGLFKQFVKALDKESTTFAYLAEKFPSLSQAKIKEGVFIGPQIRKIVLDETFITHLKRKEKLAFESSKKVCDNFLGNHRSDNYVQVVNDLLSHYHGMGCSMFLKVHVLHCHLYFLQKILVMWVMSMVRDSIKIFQWWSNDSKENGTLACQ